ncbi:MAG: hypothetical protein JSV86_15990 [Gemmatimonadota bacterium]|nr:MAG: hypothetical protein JSV86_15990 [Gemmatimonadota bacterium]
MGIWISKVFEDDTLVRLKVDGQVVGSWTSVLEEEVLKHRAEGRLVVLDFAAVYLVGPQALEVLKRLKTDGVKIIDMHPLVEQLFEEV